MGGAGLFRQAEGAASLRKQPPVEVVRRGAPRPAAGSPRALPAAAGDLTRACRFRGPGFAPAPAALRPLEAQVVFVGEAGAVVLPGDLHEVAAAVGIVERVAGDLVVPAGVVGHEGVARVVAEEGVVPRPVEAHPLAGAQRGLAQLAPGVGVEQVRSGGGAQQPDAVARAGGAGRKADVDMVLVRKEEGALVDPEVVPLPVVGRGGEQDLRRFEGQRGIHLGDIKVGDLLAEVDLPGPHAIAPAAMLKGGQVEGEVVEAEIVRAPGQALLAPGAREWVAALAAKRLGADVPHIVDVARGEIEVPCPVQPVQLRSPDVAAHRPPRVALPEDRLRRGAQAASVSERRRTTRSYAGTEAVNHPTT